MAACTFYQHRLPRARWRELGAPAADRAPAAAAVDRAAVPAPAHPDLPVAGARRSGRGADAAGHRARVRHGLEQHRAPARRAQRAVPQRHGGPARRLPVPGPVRRGLHRPSPRGERSRPPGPGRGRRGAELRPGGGTPAERAQLRQRRGLAGRRLPAPGRRGRDRPAGVAGRSRDRQRGGRCPGERRRGAVGAAGLRAGRRHDGGDPRRSGAGRGRPCRHGHRLGAAGRPFALHRGAGRPGAPAARGPALRPLRPPVRHRPPEPDQPGRPAVVAAAGAADRRGGRSGAGRDLGGPTGASRCASRPVRATR